MVEPIGHARSAMTCKGIKREATCGLAFDFRSCQALKRNDMQNGVRGDKRGVFDPFLKEVGSKAFTMSKSLKLLISTVLEKTRNLEVEKIGLKLRGRTRLSSVFSSR